MNRLGCFAERFKRKAAEAFEIAVKRPQCGAMLDGERGQMRVRSEIAAGPCGDQQPRENLGVASGRMQHARLRLGEPGPHHGKRILHGEWFRENTATGRQADKTWQRHPRQANGGSHGVMTARVMLS